MSQVLHFLITADWYQEYAAMERIVITKSQVAQALASYKRKQFPTPAAYQSFLRLTGQTNRDILFRVRISLIYETLIKKKAHGHAQVVDRQVRKKFGPRTFCARYYVMADCVGYRRDAGAA